MLANCSLLHCFTCYQIAKNKLTISISEVAYTLPVQEVRISMVIQEFVIFKNKCNMFSDFRDWSLLYIWLSAVESTSV